MLNAWMKGCDSFLGIQDTLKALEVVKGLESAE